MASGQRNVLWFCVALIVFTAYWYLWASAISPGGHPDEHHHLLYIKQVVEGRWLPDYSPGSSNSYLSHPPLYYTLVGTAVWLLQKLGGEPTAWLAAINYGIGAIAVLLLADFARVISDDDPAWIAAAVCALTIPFFTYLFTGPNSDNLGVLLVFATANFCARLYRSEDPIWFHLAIATVLLAALTKATTAIQAGALAVPGAIFVLRRDGVRVVTEVLRSPLVLGLVLITGLYYAWVLAAHGELLPSPVKFTEFAATARPDSFSDEPLPLFDYLRKFANTLLVQATGVYSGHKYTYTRSVLSFWPLAYLISFLGVAALVVFSKQMRWIGVSICLAIVIFGASHFVAGYSLHLDSGYLGGQQFRYYLPLASLCVVTAIVGVLRLISGTWLKITVTALLIVSFGYHDMRSLGLEPPVTVSRPALALPRLAGI